MGMGSMRKLSAIVKRYRLGEGTYRVRLSVGGGEGDPTYTLDNDEGWSSGPQDEAGIVNLLRRLSAKSISGEDVGADQLREMSLVKGWVLISVDPSKLSKLRPGAKSKDT